MDKNRLSRVSRRMIGQVNVFDISGSIKGEDIRKVGDYIAAYMKEGDIQYTILNIQELDYVDNNSIKDIVTPFEPMQKSLIYYDDADLAEVFRGCEYSPIQQFMNQERDVVRFMGPELLNQKAAIFFEEKRGVVRIPAAIATDLIIQQKDGKGLITTHGIISNLSESGVLVEYLDLHSGDLIQQIDYFKNFEVTLNAYHKFYVHQNLCGEIVRVEISGKQTSLAIKFASPIEVLHP